MPVYEPVGGADEASIEVSSAEDGAVLREGWFRAVTQRSWSSAMMHAQSDADSQTHSEPLWLEIKETGTLTVYSDRMKRGLTIQALCCTVRSACTAYPGH
jgi:hypothetical protein